MALTTAHSVRILDQEIDTVEICPGSPDYMVIGTYSLIGQEQRIPTVTKSNQDEDPSPAILSRIGSVQIWPVDPNTAAMPLEQQNIWLARQDLPCAVLDIKFCPTDDNLLGAATSNGELRFFRIIGLPTNTDSCSTSIQIIPLGIAKASGEEDDEIETPPLITQFVWLSSARVAIREPESQGDIVHYLAACDTSGQAKLMSVIVPYTISTDVFRDSVSFVQPLPSEIVSVHKHLHNLEAWTIAAVPLPDIRNTFRGIVLSGGDDSCLIASDCTFNLQSLDLVADGNAFDLKSSSTRIHIDRRTHIAGVVSVLPLPATSFTQSVANADNSQLTHRSIPVLTGSYDQHLRLYLFNATTLQLKIVPELDLKLEGGVWRITLLDTYHVSNSKDHVRTVYILLVSAMHAGAYIARLSSPLDDGDADGGELGWSWTVEARFMGSHESMVYACAAKEIAVGHDDRTGKWKIVSTSFYDKRVCVWEWCDDRKSRLC